MDVYKRRKVIKEWRLLSLDYDEVSKDFILNELHQLRLMFRITLQLYQSSENNYHIRSKKAIPLNLALKILLMSRCSLDYKNFCYDKECFPIREGHKIHYVDGVPTDTRLPPRLILEV